MIYILMSNFLWEWYANKVLLLNVINGLVIKDYSPLPLNILFIGQTSTLHMDSCMENLFLCCLRFKRDPVVLHAPSAHLIKTALGLFNCPQFFSHPAWISTCLHNFSVFTAETELRPQLHVFLHFPWQNDLTQGQSCFSAWIQVVVLCRDWVWPH